MQKEVQTRKVARSVRKKRAKPRDDQVRNRGGTCRTEVKTPKVIASKLKEGKGSVNGASKRRKIFRIAKEEITSDLSTGRMFSRGG